VNGVAAMILAGGQGERLSILSRQRAKPAVPFAGKYRIIDFTLSNCVNSGITDVAVLTQYRPHSLNDHIGIGQPWDLDRSRGGIHLLQPYLGRARSDWYRGTADAIYHNLWYVMPKQFDEVLILSGDHIYAMDYRPMLDFHRQRKASVTVCVQPVPLEDASRFGLLVTDDDDRVIAFQEKPENPRSTLASMGIYVFDKNLLVDTLEVSENSAVERTMLDFGKDIIPSLIEQGDVYAYAFGGYWQDVGTLQSFWETNLALLEDLPELNLYDPDWVIHTRSEERPPAKIMEGSHVSRSLVSNGCIIIRGTVDHSVLSPGVVVRDGAVVRDSIIMGDTVIAEGAVVERCIIDKQAYIGPGCRLGFGDDTPNMLDPRRVNTGITLVGKNARIPANVTIGRNVIIAPEVQEHEFTSQWIASGETVDSRMPSWA
jgi:glucose-1-phosphate adenylyltransferase